MRKAWAWNVPLKLNPRARAMFFSGEKGYDLLL